MYLRVYENLDPHGTSYVTGSLSLVKIYRHL